MASYRKNLVLSLGPISTQVNLEAVAPRKRSSLTRLCPDHTVKLSQKYRCPGTTSADEHDVAWGTWNTGVEIGDGYKIVDIEEKPSVESAGGLTLTPVPKKSLEASTLEGDGLYYAVPSNKHAEDAWAIFRKLVSGKVALIARGALRTGSEKIWRVTTFNGYLVLREIRFPENLKPSPEAVEARVDRVTYSLVTKFAESLTTEWDDFDSVDSVAVQISEWLDSGTEVEAGEVGEEARPVLDLRAALMEALRE